MNRKEFFRSCAGGLCACGAASLAAPDEAAAQTATPGDWRLPFVKRRYAKLLELLGNRLDAKALDGVLEELGRFCSSTVRWIDARRGDPDGYFQQLKQRWNEDAAYDREKGIITIASAPRTECVCPLIESSTPKAACNCSLGWQQRSFETVLGHKVRAELKESVLRGGKRCVFEIHVGEALPKA